MKGMLCLLLALWLLCTGSAAAGAELDELRLCVCPLHRADAMVLVQGSHAALIDTGEARDAPVIAALLKKLQAASPEFVLNTHPITTTWAGCPRCWHSAARSAFSPAFRKT